MRLKEISVWVAVVLLGLFFLVEGSLKIFGWNPQMMETQLEYLRGYGLGRDAYFVIGLIELLGALSIWWHKRHWIAGFGAACMLIPSIGAIIMHNVHDSFQESIAAIIAATLSLIVLRSNWGLLKAGLLASPRPATDD